MEKKIAVIGGTDHGKTTFIKAVAEVFGTQVKNCSGDDFNIGRTETEIEFKGKKYLFFDYPAINDYEENIDGTEDAAVWVVDSCEGPMFGSREMLALCIERGIENYLLFMNKSDLVEDEEIVELCEAETREVMDEEGLFSDDYPSVSGSAKKAHWDPESEWGYDILEVVKNIAAMG